MKVVAFADERGDSLVEILVALAIVAIVVTAFLAALSTGSFGVATVRQRVTAENLVRAQLELIQTTPYTITFGEAGGNTVAIQPFATEGEDTYIKEDDPDKNEGGKNEFKVKFEHGENKENRALLQFDLLPSLPPDATIDSATLSLWVKEVKPEDVPITIKAHQITQPWVEGGGKNPGATWDTYDGSSPWDNEGGDYEGSTLDSTSLVGADDEVDWAYWDVTGAAQGWFDYPATNFGVILVPDIDGGKNEAKFTSSDEGKNPFRRPKLLVTYTTSTTPTVQAYPTVVPPPGYSVTVASPEIGEGLQAIIVTVFYHGQQLLQVESYKVDR